MKNRNLIQQNWENKISNPAQLGGIETAVLDNGLGRGTRIAWINTGTGLRYKVVIDRAMDIADAFYNQYSLAWLSNGGVMPPSRFSDKGMGWIRTFGGGLLATCGLAHIGGPEKDEHGERGLHGTISNTPAEIISIVQPDPRVGNMEMSISGIIRQTQVFGPILELRRTISGALGEAKIKIHDQVINRGNSNTPHMMLYHFNFGWPLVNEGTDIFWQGDWTPLSTDSDDSIFKDGNNFHQCPPPLKAHSGPGEDVACIDVEADSNGNCICGLHNQNLDLAIAINFRKNQLPWLTNWQHWGQNEYVTGLEPGTNPPIGQAKARAQHELIVLTPDEIRNYELEIEVLRGERIGKIMNTN